jgi:hypothetical protein
MRASDSPLPHLADVCTPQEAMARLKILDRQRKTQVMVMFRRVKGQPAAADGLGRDPALIPDYYAELHTYLVNMGAAPKRASSAYG